MAKQKRPSFAVRKRKARIRRITLVGIILLGIIGLISIFPVIGHIKEIRSALDRYDFIRLTGELAWIDENASWLKKVPMIRDGEFWLKLNQGEYEDLESKLAQFSDDKHQFWLFQVHLLMDQENKAQQDIQTLKSSSLRALAEGLLLVKEGDYQKASDKMRTAPDSKLSQDQLVLKYISISRIEMSLGNLDRAQDAWESANKLSPLYPLVVETEYDLTLVSGQWGRAKELSRQLEELPEYAKRSELFLIKKALLALTVGERQIYQQAREELGTQKNGEAYLDYLSGIEFYEQGKFKEAAENFQSALNYGLPESVQRDAENALAQAKERIQAENALNQAKKQH